jgi:peptide/nickel transport system substrate-binding protein
VIPIDDAIGQLAAIGSRTPGFNHDIASKIQGVMMALDEIVELSRDVDVQRAAETAQTALGGPLAGGTIATTILPPTVTGYKKADTYPSAGNKGDLMKAKEQLTACGKPNGFAMKLAARSDRPKEIADAQAIQQALAKAGIKTEIKQYPAGDYFNKYAGAPSYVKQAGLGLMMMKWGADWPTGFGFLQQIVDGRAIKPSGGTNLQETNLPAVNAMLDKVAAESDVDKRNEIYTQIDQTVMNDAGIVPLTYANQLLYRPPNVTNVFVTAAYSGQYSYLNLGVKGAQ